MERSTGGTKLSARLKILATVVGLLIWACAEVNGGQDQPFPGDEELLRDLLESEADNVLGPSFVAFAASAHELEAATSAYATVVAQGGADVEASRVTAQQAWLDAAANWQLLEVMQLGPAGSSTDAIGGEDLRDEVYSWPGVNDCRIDQEIVLGEFDQADFIETRLVNAYGLDAVEYLLFWSGPENACSPQLPINAEGQWDALGSEEIDRRRAAYAASISGSLASTADDLAATWDSGGDYNAWLANPTAPDSPYGSIRSAMDELMRVMFYVDLWVKDAKVSVPAGLMDCPTPTCPAALESRHARASKAHVVANLEGLQRLYLGGPSAEEGTGFDDLLMSIGEDELSRAITSELTAAIQEVEAVEGSFLDALTADENALDESHAAIKRVTDLLKGDFATVLTLQIPKDGAGDAD